MADLISGAETIYHEDGHLACMTPEFGQTLARACIDVAQRVRGR
jgi:hypothetical protein